MNIPNEAWLPAAPDLTSGSLCRSADQLLRVVKQFDVENAARYQPQKDSSGRIARTFCNIFAADCLQALGVSAPLHWWMASELVANTMKPWLDQHGKAYGWTCIIEADARAQASAGCPVMALWRNPAGEGHVAIVLPSPADGPTIIAQAGAKCFVGGPLENGFGDRKPEFWAHG
jgi:hypothetical protein